MARPRRAHTTLREQGSLADAIGSFRDRLSDDVFRKAAAAGAKVFYVEMRLRVPVGETQNLYNSIYHYWIKDKSTGGRQVYAIGPNMKKAPHWHFTEYGHWRVNRIVRINGKLVSTRERLSQPQWVPAKPWIRPTFTSKVGAAMDAARAEIREQIAEMRIE